MTTNHGIEHTDRLTRLHRGRNVPVRILKNLLIQRVVKDPLIDIVLLCHTLQDGDRHLTIRLRNVDASQSLNKRQIRCDMSIELIIRRGSNDLDTTRTRGSKQRLQRFHSSGRELHHLMELINEQHDLSTLGLRETLSLIEQSLQARSHLFGVRQVSDHLCHVDFQVDALWIILHTGLHEHRVVRNNMASTHLIQVCLRVDHDTRHLNLAIGLDHLSDHIASCIEGAL